MHFPVAVPVPVTMLEEFKENLQLALSWMEDVQRRLKANDCTEGPRDALEARLRETKVGGGALSDWIKQNENVTAHSCRGRQWCCALFSPVHRVPLLIFHAHLTVVVRDFLF